MDSRDGILGDLIRLFDDTDNTVIQCVNGKLRSMGRSVVGELAGIAEREGDDFTRRLILEKMEHVNREFRFEDLARLSDEVSGPGFSLYEPAFVISSIFDAGLSRDSFQEMYCRCASTLPEEISQEKTALENIEIFNHHFFRTMEFSISDDGFSDPGAALLPKVMKSRCGNPFTVALLWFMMAEDAGLPLYPVCFRGGFIPTYLEKGRELFYINLNDNGSLLSEADIAGVLKGEDGAKTLQIHSRSVIPGIWAESMSEVFSRCGSSHLKMLAERAVSVWTSERFLKADAI